MKVAEATYQQVIENALSAVRQFDSSDQSETDEDVIEYLLYTWLPFAADVKRTWQENENRPHKVI